MDDKNNNKFPEDIKLQAQRQDKVAGFQLSIDPDKLDSGTDYISMDNVVKRPVVSSAAPSVSSAAVPDEKPPAKEDRSQVKRRRQRKAKKAWNWTRALIYAAIVIGVSGFLVFYGVTGTIDFIGFDKSDIPVTLSVSEEQSTDIGKLAKLLKENDIIDQPLIFRLYCRMAGVKSVRAHEKISLRASRGYKGVINSLKSIPRQTVNVTFQEGMSALEIGKKLEENDVCTADAFLAALEKEDYSHSFLSDMPNDGDYKHRIRRLEGFLFPDTYEFYIEQDPKTVVSKFLDNFNSKVDINLRTKMKNEGLESVYQTLILASLIEWEANADSMTGISRVIRNRLEKPSVTGGKLQCDSTYRYLDQFIPKVNGKRQTDNDYFKYYDTYQRAGLPISPICNPGMDAIEAALNPATSGKALKSYYFATDQDTGITHYSQTYTEHVKICKKYGIGYYAQ